MVFFVKVGVMKISCPKCGSRMHMKTGRMGRFYSCNAFPSCRGTIDLHKVFVAEHVEAAKEAGIKEAARAIAEMRKQHAR